MRTGVGVAVTMLLAGCTMSPDEGEGPSAREKFIEGIKRQNDELAAKKIDSILYADTTLDGLISNLRPSWKAAEELGGHHLLSDTAKQASLVCYARILQHHRQIDRYQQETLTLEAKEGLEGLIGVSQATVEMYVDLLKNNPILRTGTGQVERYLGKAGHQWVGFEEFLKNTIDDAERNNHLRRTLRPQTTTAKLAAKTE